MLDVQPTEKSEYADKVQFLNYNLVGLICLDDFSHYVAGWQEHLDGDYRWFFYDGMAPLKSRIRKGDLMSWKSEQSNVGLAVELLDDLMPLPSRYKPHLMIYQRSMARRINWKANVESIDMTSVTDTP
jgi:hypothetical protein